jgi:GNAT superfamily N-acetyltransferase
MAGGHELHDTGSVRWYHTGADEGYANAVLVTGLEDDGADAAIDALLRELRGRRAPFVWWVMPSARPSDLGDRLRIRGLVAADAWPGMAVATSELVEPPPVDGLEIRRVASDGDFVTYLDTFAPILSPSPAFTELIAAAGRAIGFAEDAPEIHFVGWRGGDPVATASLVVTGGAAGIYNVTTVQPARGRGIGAAMTAAAVRAGRERGMAIATLQASTMGRPVYERLGFRFVCDLVPYRPAPRGFLTRSVSIGA